MTAVTPTNTRASLASKRRRIGVFVAPATGEKPTKDDEDETLRVISIRRFAGSAMAEAVLSVDLGKRQQRIEDAEIHRARNRQVEIWVMKDSESESSESGSEGNDVDDEASDDPRDVPLFWGELLAQPMQVGPGETETETLIARVQGEHFGDPLNGQLVWDPQDGETYVVDLDLEFNPEIDGIPVPNKHEAGVSIATHPIWVDPESVQSDTAKEYAAGGDADDIEAWTLADVVEVITEWANGDEDHVENPGSQVNDVMGEDADEPAPEVRNLIIPRGLYVPQALDAALHPFGYDWRLVCKKGDSEESLEMQPRIEVFRVGAGEEKTLLLQAIGEDLDLALSNVKSLSLNVDIGRLHNFIRVQGALIEREFTLPLYRCWGESADGDVDHSDVDNRVGRKWVANEAGDYNGLRTEITEPPELVGFSGVGWTPKRRALDDCLTMRDGQRIPPVLEWRPDDSTDWQPVPEEWGWRLLPDQVGIWFTGVRASDDDASVDGIPSEVLTDTVELRITGTLRGDWRIEGTDDRTESSPNSNTRERLVDASDQFFDRQRQTTGDYASVLTGPADERDDQDAIDDYAEQIARTASAAVITAQVVCRELALEYEIGDIITEVEGRALSLNRKTRAANDPTYLVIVGIEHRFAPDIETVLTVAPYDRVT